MTKLHLSKKKKHIDKKICNTIFQKVLNTGIISNHLTTLKEAQMDLKVFFAELLLHIAIVFNYGNG